MGIVTREAIYNANVVKIEEHNKAKREWTMDVNVFADLEEDEFLAQYTGASPPPPSDQPTFEVEYSDEVADAVDWVQKGLVNPIKNQGQCGSCWAFSTMGTLESGYAIATGNLVSVAEQQLVDCDKSNDGSAVDGHTQPMTATCQVPVCALNLPTPTQAVMDLAVLHLARLPLLTVL